MKLINFYNMLVVNRVDNLTPIKSSATVTNKECFVQRLNDQKSLLNKTVNTDITLVEKILTNTAWFNKYDMLSPYPYHRAVPSVRSLKTVDIYILEFFNEKSCISKYNPFLNRLEEYRLLNQHEIRQLSAQLLYNKIYFIYATDFENLADKYGEFAYQLCLLDTGHLLGQASIVLQRLHINGKVKVFDQIISNISKMDIIDNDSEILSILAVDSFLLNVDDNDFRLTIDCIEKRKLSFNVFERFTYSKLIRKSIQSKSSQIILPRLRENSFLLKCSDLEFNEVSFKRTSAHNSLGQVGIIIPDNSAKIFHIFNDIFFNTLDTRINIYVLIRNTMNYGLYMYNQSNGKLTKTNKFIEFYEMDNISIQKKSSITLDSYSAVVFMSTKLIDELNNQKNLIDIEKTYLGCGIIAQYICMNAAKESLFTRPIKGTNENFINKFLNEKLFYTLLIGKSNFNGIYQSI